jgi:hypothetical protein
VSEKAWLRTDTGVPDPGEIRSHLRRSRRRQNRVGVELDSFHAEYRQDVWLEPATAAKWAQWRPMKFAMNALRRFTRPARRREGKHN